MIFRNHVHKESRLLAIKRGRRNWNTKSELTEKREVESAEGTGGSSISNRSRRHNHHSLWRHRHSQRQRRMQPGPRVAWRLPRAPP